MRYVANRGYTDIELKRYVEKGEDLEVIYRNAKVELTDKRINYLVNERKLYTEEETKERTVNKEDKKTVKNKRNTK